MNTRFGRVLSVSLALGLSSAALAGTHSPELETLSSSKLIDVIVTYSDAAHAAAITTGQKLSNLPGGELRRTTVADAIRISAMAEVANVSLNHSIFSTSVPTPGYDFMPQSIQPVTKPAFGIQVLGQGNGVKVAVIDSGIDAASLDLQNFGATVVYSKSFVAGEDANDYFGHGTHVAGLIAGTGFNSLLYTHDIFGVSPGANLYNLKVLDKNGMSDDATVISAIDQAISLKVNVINLSLGRPVYESFHTDPLCQEVEKAWLAGITVVVAAGNDGRLSALTVPTDGYGTIASPANDPLVLTVGAINTESSPDRRDRKSVV